MKIRRINNGKIFYFGNDVIPKYSFNAKELDEETGMYYFEARYYRAPTFISRDPLMNEKPWLTPYHYCSNNPVGRIDPSGMMDWEPDKDGNLIAEEGDNASTLATFLNISTEQAKFLLNIQGISSDNVPAGSKVKLNNEYTRSLAKHGDLNDGNPALNYNCWGSAIAGTFGEEISYEKGINCPQMFDEILEKQFSSVDKSNAVFGKTVIRFAKQHCYDDAEFDNNARMGCVNRGNLNETGSASHGAVYYGTSKNGTIYVYSKNGWDTAPKIMKLQDVINLYGNIQGIGNGTGFYNRK